MEEGLDKRKDKILMKLWKNGDNKEKRKESREGKNEWNKKLGQRKR